jgi:hypothetical protein
LPSAAVICAQQRCAHVHTCARTVACMRAFFVPPLRRRLTRCATASGGTECRRRSRRRARRPCTH